MKNELKKDSQYFIIRIIIHFQIIINNYNLN